MELRQVSAQRCRHDHIDMRVHVGIQRCSDAWAYLGNDWGIEAYQVGIIQDPGIVCIPIYRLRHGTLPVPTLVDS